MNIYEDIREYSKKRGYSELLTTYWIQHPKCQILGCSGNSQCPHHIKSRGSGGTDQHSNLIALCVGHHAQVHQYGWKSFAGGIGAFYKDKIYSAMGEEI